MDTELDLRLKEALAKRDRLASNISRISGRKDAAEQALSAIELEIRAKNLDPDTLGEYIAKLQEAYEREVSSLEVACDKASQELTPYLELTR